VLQQNSVPNGTDYGYLFGSWAPERIPGVAIDPKDPLGGVLSEPSLERFQGQPLSEPHIRNDLVQAIFCNWDVGLYGDGTFQPLEPCAFTLSASAFPERDTICNAYNEIYFIGSILHN
jgi:hypothetical protein